MYLQVEVEGGAVWLCVIDLDGAAHLFGDHVGYDQSESGAPISARDRWIGLREWLEEVVLLFVGDANAGVADGEPQRAVYV